MPKNWERYDYAKKMIDAGVSVDDVATAFGISRTRVVQMLDALARREWSSLESSLSVWWKRIVIGDLTLHEASVVLKHGDRWHLFAQLFDKRSAAAEAHFMHLAAREFVRMFKGAKLTYSREKYRVIWRRGEW